jgi:uncharacterized protein (DUF2141 family)
MRKISWHVNRVALVLGILCSFVSLGLVPAPAQSSQTSTLTVHINGARNTKGKIGVLLFQSPDGFPSEPSKAIRQERINIDSGTLSAEATFKDLPDGTYAVSVLHDENDNGKMDKNFMGIPKEGYGASNNPRKRMGPPGFVEAKFSVTQPQQTIEIKLMY